MTAPSVRVTTASGIDAVVTLHVDSRSVRIVVEAVPSDTTAKYEQKYELQLKEYQERAALGGLEAAGAPPLSGAGMYLTEVEVLPPPALSGIGQGVRLVGGTGTEWRITWVWSNSPLPAGESTFVIRSGATEAELRASPNS
jgi:hypothetical protein